MVISFLSPCFLQTFDELISPPPKSYFSSNTPPTKPNYSDPNNFPWENCHKSQKMLKRLGHGVRCLYWLQSAVTRNTLTGALTKRI